MYTNTTSPTSSTGTGSAGPREDVRINQHSDLSQHKVGGGVVLEKGSQGTCGLCDRLEEPREIPGLTLETRG